MLFTKFAASAVPIRNGRRHGPLAISWKGCDIKQPGPIEFAGAMREHIGRLMRKSRSSKRRILRMTCRMCWSTVDVETGRAASGRRCAEIGQIGAEDVELVHAPEFVHDAALACSNLRKAVRLGGGTERALSGPASA